MSSNDQYLDLTEEEASFEKILYDAISPKVKKFLFDFYGDQFLNLEPETFIEIDVLIKKSLYSCGEEIPDILFRNRKIWNIHEFDQALENFVPDNKPINWPKADCWFNRAFLYEDNDDYDNYLEESDPIDLNENEIRAKEIINVADELIENTRNFAYFTKSGYEILNQEIQLFLEKTASFDLSILSIEGFKTLQNRIYFEMDHLLDDLYSLMPER